MKIQYISLNNIKCMPQFNLSRAHTQSDVVMCVEKKCNQNNEAVLGYVLLVLIELQSIFDRDSELSLCVWRQKQTERIWKLTIKHRIVNNLLCNTSFKNFSSFSHGFRLNQVTNSPIFVGFLLTKS